jgi:hypothetical protein
VWTNRRTIGTNPSQTRAHFVDTLDGEGGGLNPTLLKGGGCVGTWLDRAGSIGTGAGRTRLRRGPFRHEIGGFGDRLSDYAGR